MVNKFFPGTSQESLDFLSQSPLVGKYGYSIAFSHSTGALFANLLIETKESVRMSAVKGLFQDAGLSGAVIASLNCPITDILVLMKRPMYQEEDLTIPSFESLFNHLGRPELGLDLEDAKGLLCYWTRFDVRTLTFNNPYKGQLELPSLIPFLVKLIPDGTDLRTIVSENPNVFSKNKAFLNYLIEEMEHPLNE